MDEGSKAVVHELVERVLSHAVAEASAVQARRGLAVLQCAL